jgi:RNA polymerase sigma-70 factor (ECF subfamily)
METAAEALMPTQPLPDATLVVRARDGERDAREALASRAGEAAYVFALQLTRSPDSAHDIAQDSVMKFFRTIDRFDAQQPLEPWLFSIVRNQVRDAARRASVRRHDSLDTWLAAGGSEPAANDDPAASAERHELQRQVWRAISELSDSHREILVLRDYHGLAYREIADVLSIPTGTVMSRLHAARTRLREVLAPQRTEDQA